MRHFFTLLAVCCLVFSVPAQTLIGTILTDSGEPVSNARVTLFNPLTGDTVPMIGDMKLQGCVAPKLRWNGNIMMAGGTEIEFLDPAPEK